MQMDKVRHLALFFGRCDVTPLNRLLAESLSKPIERERQPLRALVLHGGFEPLIVKQRKLRSPSVRRRFQVIHANGHRTEADAPSKATEEQVSKMRIEIRFPPRPWIEELLLGALDVIAMSNRQLQMSTDAALPAKRPA